MYQLVTLPHRLPCSGAFESRQRAESYARWMFQPGDVTVAPIVDGDHAAAVEQARYERGMVAEARAIASARADEQATAEHIRVLLAWLDGAPADGYQPPAPQPFDVDLPF